MVTEQEVFSTYQRLFGIDSPYEYQVEMFESLFKYTHPIILKASTGSGKTEAVVAPFLYQFLTNKFFLAPRLIYVLPMRVMIDNLSGRIAKYAAGISKHISVEVQHGRRPEAPFYVADIIVTTLDQFVYAFARSSRHVQKHIDMPSGAIASSFIVFDEAHMYRDEMTFSIMRALLEILQISRVPFVVMTATMPRRLQESLFENRSVFEKVETITGKIDLKNELEVSIETNPIFENEQANLSEDVLEIIKNKNTLVVLNQVKRAQEVYKEIKERLHLDSERIVLLHSRFTNSDRSEHEYRALSFLTRGNAKSNASKNGKKIIVSTQVLEAGIDFSAEILLTELAPADALIQRAGRCARYRGEKGKIIVFPVEHEKGHLPYKEIHLDVTRDWLVRNQNMNMKDFDKMCEFADILDYKANDFEASSSLIDLYECTLYADTRPENIQLRKGKPVTVAVIDWSKGKGRKVEDKIKGTVKEIDISKHFIQLDYGVAWGLLKKKLLSYEIYFNWEQGEWEARKAREILPFKHYVLSIENYNPEYGVIADVGTFVI